MARSLRAPSGNSPAVAPSLSDSLPSLFAQATQCHRARRLAEAAVLYEHVLGMRPDIVEVYCNLGAVLADLGRPDEAEAAYRRAIALKPDLAEAYSNLGNLLRSRSRFDEAERAYRDAIAQKADFAPAYNNLGTLLREIGRFEEAEAALVRSVALMPDYSQAYLNLGNARLSLGRHRDAEEAYRRAVAINPHYAEAHSNLGLVLKEAGRLEDAERALRHAIALRPDYPEARTNLAVILKIVGRLEEAAALLRETLMHHPEFAPAHHALANIARDAGRIGEARQSAEQAVRLAPNNPLYFRRLAEIRRIVAGEPALAAMEALAKRSDSLPPNDRIDLQFGLAKALEDVGRPDEAFRCLMAGNALKRAQIAYDEAATLGAITEIPKVFTPALVSVRARAGDPSRLPIFVVGMMRSGTTLVEQILASHPDVFGAGELKLFSEITEDFPTGHAFPAMAAHLDDEALRAIGGRYVAAVRSRAPRALRVTDKMPLNFLLVGLIHLALPNAAIIHTVRDPLDTCLSCFSQLFAEPQNHTYDLAELGRYYRHYRALMAHWHCVLPPGRILDVHYEDVVADLEGQARRILAHCGLAWDARCLDFHHTERPVLTASAAQVRRPLYASSVGRWQAYAPHLGPLIAELDRGEVSARRS